MQKDVFISYSSMNNKVADALCFNLEANNIQCWIAHRDIIPGKEYTEAIIDGINECRIFLLVLCRHASESPQVKREVERAVSKNKKIIAFRLEDFPLNKSFEFALSNIHWLEATTPPLESHILKLIGSVQNLIPDINSQNPITPPVIMKDMRQKIRPGIPKNAPNWMMKSTNGPGKRSSFGMIYDTLKEEIILNGGFGPGIGRGPSSPSRGPEQNDTWIWNGSKWILQSTKPLSILNHSLAFNKATHQPTLFGGWNGSLRMDKTLILNEEEWKINLSENYTSPETRESHAMVYDEIRRTLILFGGLTVRIPGGQIALGDTWEYDGMEWNQFHVNGPEARWGHKMIYDENNEAILLFGGTNGIKCFDDTWLWEGNLATWRKISPKNTPSARCFPGLTFDTLNQNALLFGGQGESKSPLNDLWKWDGEDWVLLAKQTPPKPRYNTGLVYDNKQNKTILYGGFDGKEYFQDTWEFIY